MGGATPRLVATDLDGTLLDADGRVSDRARAVLDALDARGVPVVFVTGRPIRWTRAVFDAVGSHGLAVVSNGALVWDVADDRPVLERPIPAEVVLDVAGRLRSGIPGLRFSLETSAGWATEPGFVAHAADDANGWGPDSEGELHDLVARGPGVLKLLGRPEGEADPDALLRAATALVGEDVAVTHSSFPLLEMSAPEVTKASTLEMLCADLGVGRADVVAFGDMPNDVPMLAWAGTSYAMADAHPSAREAARHLAPPHHEDGVARVLEELFGLAEPA